ncbi:MAG: aldo/keto reductase [Rhodothermales bacterium]
MSPWLPALMTTRSIGSLTVSTVGVGCNNFGWHIDESASHAVIHAALDAGITHFDTAELYGEGESERILGRGLGRRHQDIVLATKFGLGTNARPETVRRSAEASLQRLGTDYIDLYYLHRPDPDTPIADTLGALSELVREGKVREIGCSGFSSDQLTEAAQVADEVRFVSLQNEYSLLHREPENGILNLTRDLDMAFVPYFPLKSGLLTGKYRLGDAVPENSRLGGKPGSRFEKTGNRLLTEDNLTIVERLINFAESHGHTLLELAFGYLLAHQPVASVIAGATKPWQIESNIAAASSWALSASEINEVKALL